MESFTLTRKLFGVALLSAVVGAPHGFLATALVVLAGMLMVLPGKR